MQASTKAVILFTALSLGLGQLNSQPKGPQQRSIAMFGQPITEKRTPMPVVEISPQQRKWVVQAFLEQADSMRAEAGVKGVLRWNAILEKGAQAYADTMTTASDEQWERWGHTIGGPMAVHTGKYSKNAGCNVLAECLARNRHNSDPSEFGENEWREIGAKAAFMMKLSKNETAHYAALITNGKENKIGMGFSMHTQKVGTGANPMTQWVSDLVFWIGNP